MKTAKQRELIESMVEWSNEVGFDYKQLIQPDGGISFYLWFEKIIHCMTLDEVQIYTSIPDLPETRENPAVRKMSEIAIAHRDRLLLDAGRGDGDHAASKYAG
ncbi:hypothetical protein ACFLFF_31425 [Brevibacillus reuszeri]|uniref:hypothetical protein n=1 Tax=Brevibacillus reuszeri TaxID=54915 RepID=UPI0036701846